MGNDLRRQSLIFIAVLLCSVRASAETPNLAPLANREAGPQIDLPPEDVPLQSPIVLVDQPPAALPRTAILGLPRQGQIDVALDPRKGLHGVAVGGYGEATLNAPLDGTSPIVADLRRTILFFGCNFTDRIRFFSEVEFEHALTTAGQSPGRSGEVAVEQAFLDFMLLRWLNLRAGMSIVPVSLINLYHEPSTFNGVERPDVDTFIVPSTWKQLMAGIYGGSGPLRYQLYVTPGLRADGFSAASGIRGGVQDNQVRTRDWGVVMRLDYAPLLGMNLGLSGYVAPAGQGDPNLGRVPVAIVAFDVKLARAGFGLRAQVSYVYIGDTEKLNYVLSLARPTAGPISKHLIGGYVELAYDLLRLYSRNHGMQLHSFVRYEHTDTQLAVPASGLLLTRQPGNDRSVYTLGLTFRPIFEIAVKLDYQLRHTEVADSQSHQINFALAYQF